MRSFGRLEMNSAATSFAALKRSGLKSRAFILPEISVQITMSIPCTSLSDQLSDDCGRASAHDDCRHTQKPKNGRQMPHVVPP